MANKFHMLGLIKEVNTDSILLSVQQNFKDYDNLYKHDYFKVNLAFKTELSVSDDDVYSVYGRIEINSEHEIRLVAEQISSMKRMLH